MPKIKIEPVLISSRESMIAHVNDIVRAKLKVAKLTADHAGLLFDAFVQDQCPAARNGDQQG